MVVMIVVVVMMIMMMEAKKRTKISTITKTVFLREGNASQFSSVSDPVRVIISFVFLSYVHGACYKESTEMMTT